MALVSIIVPVYNVEKTLKRCLESILNQTFNDFEIILVNDGSSDNSLSICENFLKIDKRIKLINKKNGGLSSARNAGLKISNSKYISFIDSDDYINPKMIERLVGGFNENNKIDITIIAHNIVDSNDKILEFNSYPSAKIMKNNEALIELIKDENIYSYAWDKMYKSHLFQNVKFPENRVFEDIATTYKLFHKSRLVFHCGGPAEINYLRNPDGITGLSEKNLTNKIEKKLHTTLSFHERLMFVKEKNLNEKIISLCYKKFKVKFSELIKNLIKYRHYEVNYEIRKFINLNSFKFIDLVYFKLLFFIYHVISKLRI